MVQSDKLFVSGPRVVASQLQNSSRSRAAWLLLAVRVMILHFLAAQWPASAAPAESKNTAVVTQPFPETPRIRIAQAADDLNINIVIDSKRNQSYIKADDQFSSFVYGATFQNNTVIVQPASKEIMGTWKGQKALQEIAFASKGYFEDPAQFSPIFLIVDISNNRATSVQIKSAYLDISTSASDLQPYLMIGDWGRLQCNDGSYNPKFTITNYGWGAVRDAKLIYSFARAPATEFTANVGTFDQTTTASIEGGLEKSSLDIKRVKAGKFKCASQSVIPACLAKVKSSGILGNLSDSVYLNEINVLADAVGRIEYDWASSDGHLNKRSSPFTITIPLFKFDLGGPECGAPGPVDRHEKPIVLSLDKNNYRISLDWRGQLMSQQNKRLALALSAPKSSHHLARLVLELSDGSTATSPQMDILYFTPRMPQ